jgi:hypothetical protein
MGNNYSILIAVFASLGAYLVASFARVGVFNNNSNYRFI